MFFRRGHLIPILAGVLFICTLFFSMAIAPEMKAREFHSPCQHQKKSAWLQVLDSVYTYSAAGVRVVANGHLVATGDCHPRLAVGLIKQSNTGDWDTLIDVRHIGMRLCGLPDHQWSADTMQVQLPLMYYPHLLEELDFTGRYKLTFIELSGKKRRIKSSNTFVIKPLEMSNTGAPQPMGFYDSTSVESFQFGQLDFYHLRVFSHGMGRSYYVWHRLRIKKRWADTYCYDEVHQYTLTPYSGNVRVIETEDYNLDGFVDFKIKSFGRPDVSTVQSLGQSGDYYLFDPQKDTFVYAALFSLAESLVIDHETHTMVARYSKEVPLEGTYLLEATFALPRLEVLAVHRIWANGREQVDAGLLQIFSREISSLPNIPIINELHGNTPKLTTRMKHHFPGDSVTLIMNRVGALSDLSALNFQVEKRLTGQDNWKVLLSGKYGPDLPWRALNSIHISIGMVCGKKQVSEEHFCYSTRGEYRISIRHKGALIARTPSFYVHD